MSSTRWAMDASRPPAHVFLLKAANPVADGGFHFRLGFHGDLKCEVF